MSIYKNTVIVDGAFAITSCGGGKHYICNEASVPADYTITLPTTGISEGTLLYFSGSPTLTKIVGIGNEDISASDELQLRWNGGGWVRLGEREMQSNRTIHLNSSMGYATIQAIIERQPKNLNAHTLTFQFANGTYNWAASDILRWSYFSNGWLNVFGDTVNETGQHSDQAVVFNAVRTSDYPTLEFMGNRTIINVACIRIVISGNTWARSFSCYGSNNLQVRDSSFKNDANGIGVWGYFSELEVLNCLFDNCTYDIYMDKAKAYSSNNASTGTTSTTGLCADGGTIVRRDSQPSGTQTTVNGGVIR